MDYRALSDAALLQRLRELAARERRATAEFVACLAEADRRPKAIIGQGYPSLYEFCVRDLRLAQSSAYKRVNAAREANRRPEILCMLAEGTLTLSVLCLIAPLLPDHPTLLESVKGKAKRDVETLIAPLGAPRHVPDRIRPLTVVVQPPACPDLFSAQTSVEEPRKEEASEPTAPEPKASGLLVETKLEFRFVADSSLLEAIERLRQLLWHRHPAGRLEDVLLVAVKDYVARKDPAREIRLAAACAPGGPKGRRVPARVRRIVWRRDEGRCAFVGPAGRCDERRSLEIDHIVPWALGGRSDDPSNLRLLCRAHNQSEAERIFGRILPGGKNVDN